VSIRLLASSAPGPGEALAISIQICLARARSPARSMFTARVAAVPPRTAPRLGVQELPGELLEERLGQRRALSHGCEPVAAIWVPAIVDAMRSRDGDGHAFPSPDRGLRGTEQQGLVFGVAQPATENQGSSRSRLDEALAVAVGGDDLETNHLGFSKDHASSRPPLAAVRETRPEGRDGRAWGTAP